jgi:DNA gyrase subunit A
LQNFLELAPDEKVTAVLALPTKGDFGEYLVMTTRKGLIKKTHRDEFSAIRRSGLKALTLKDDDALEWVAASSGNDQIILVSHSGKAIRFLETDVRPMGRTAAGVRGMSLPRGDEVVAMHIIPKERKKDQQVLVITEQGFGKRTPVNDYRLQRRGGSGIKTANVTKKTGSVINAALIHEDEVATFDLLITSEKGQVIRIPVQSVSKQGRSTQGVRVMRPSEEAGLIATFTTWQSNG